MEFTPEQMRQLNNQVKNGWIKMTPHPELPNIRSFCYTNKTTYDSHWNRWTLMCKGMILCDNKIVALGPGKFFNVGEREDSSLEYIAALIEKHGSVTISEKYDGTLIIPYNNGENMCCATKGSFDNEFINLSNKIYSPTNCDNWPFYEFIPNKNMEHVLDYGCDGDRLVKLGESYLDNDLRVCIQHRITYPNYGNYGSDFKISFCNRGGNNYLPTKINELLNIVKDLSFAKAIDFVHMLYGMVRGMTNTEGFVLNVGGACFKLKTADYCQQKYYMEYVTPKNVIKLIEEDKFRTVYDKITNKDTQLTMMNIQHEVWDKYTALYKPIIKTFNKINDPGIKKFAQKAKTYKYSAMLFALYKEKDDVLNKLLWKEIKNEYKNL